MTHVCVCVYIYIHIGKCIYVDIPNILARTHEELSPVDLALLSPVNALTDNIEA